MSVHNARNALFFSEGLQAGIESARALQQSQGHALHGGLGDAARCSKLTASLQHGVSLQRRSCGREAAELQAILQASYHGTPPASCFGVSPPCRNGWSGGAANPAAHDPSWSRVAVSASRKSLATLRELETTGGPSFLRGDLLVGSPQMGSMDCSPHTMHTPAMQAPASVMQQQQQPTAQAVGGGGSDGLPFSCHTQYFTLHQ